MDYIKKEWNNLTSEIRNMKKRQLIGSAVNLGQLWAWNTAPPLF
jgi:hypothetical protein